MKKGIALEMIAAMTLAFVGVAVLIAMFSSSFSGSFKGVYCSAYSKVLYILPHSGPVPTPKGCGTSNEENQIIILAKDPNFVAVKLAGYIMNCWEKYQGYGNVREVCYGLNIKGLEGFVNESMINKKLIEQKLCPSKIENSQIDSGSGITCGAKNQIRFLVEKIKQGDFIVISFFNETIEVG